MTFSLGVRNSVLNHEDVSILKVDINTSKTIEIIDSEIQVFSNQILKIQSRMNILHATLRPSAKSSTRIQDIIDGKVDILKEISLKCRIRDLRCKEIELMLNKSNLERQKLDVRNAQFKRK